MPIVHVSDIVFQPLSKDPRLVNISKEPPFGFLTVLGFAGKSDWFFACRCGNFVKTKASSVLSGATRSCGCYHRQQTGRINSKGRIQAKPEYWAWHALKQRCINPNHPEYKNYGARGIKVCGPWLTQEGFTAFLADMGERPSPKHSIDRIDNNGSYSPENCRWATTKEQARNKRSNRLVIYQGIAAPLIAHCERIGIRYALAQKRIRKLNWSIERALETPARQRHQ